MASDYTLNVQVRATQLPEGTFKPSFFATQQGGRTFRTLSLVELEEKVKVFDTEEGAIAFGKKVAYEILEKTHPEARIIIS